MPDTELIEAGRAVTALRTGLRQRAELPAFRPLDVTELVTEPHPSRRASRWISLSVGVAAVGAAIALLVPQGLGELPVPATPAQSPSPGVTPSASPVAQGVWELTAPSPLSPRRDAVVAWVGDSYFIIGGLGEPSCPHYEDYEGQQDCPDAQPLADGARYDPATDSWNGIAPAPQAVFSSLVRPGPNVAVLGRTVYLLAPDGDRLLAYDVDSDRWDSLPAPKDATTLMAADAMLVGYPWGDAVNDVRYETFDPATGVWTSHVPDAKTPSTITGASVVANTLVISSLPEGDDTSLSVVLIDLTSGRVTDVARVRGIDTPTPGLRLSSVVVGGLVAWPRGDQSEDANSEARQAWFLDPATDVWTSVELPKKSSGLSGRSQRSERDWYITTDTMIALRGQFYDPVARRWSEVPALPVPADDPIVVGGADSVLVCYGEYDGKFSGQCYLLRPAPPTVSEVPQLTHTPVPPSTPPSSVVPEPGEAPEVATAPVPPSEAPDLSSGPPSVAPEVSIAPVPPSTRPPGR